jgi:DNA (cytosine-5)-methyltransferase 1
MNGAKGVACGFYWTEGIRGLGWAVDAVPTLRGGSTIGIPSPPEILLPSGRVVTPDIRDAERLQGFRANWTRPAEKVARGSVRWKLIGNAVTVDVAEWLGQQFLRLGGDIDVEGRPMKPGQSWPRAAWNVGKGRFEALLSTWPVRRKAAPLAGFLRYPTSPLSAKATAGFLERTRRSTLRFPDGFLTRLEKHLARTAKR